MIPKRIWKNYWSTNEWIELLLPFFKCILLQDELLGDCRPVCGSELSNWCARKLAINDHQLWFSDWMLEFRKVETVNNLIHLPHRSEHLIFRKDKKNQKKLFIKTFNANKFLNVHVSPPMYWYYLFSTESWNIWMSSFLVFNMPLIFN